MNAFTCRDEVFDEEAMLQEKIEIEDKTQSRASDSSAGTQKNRVEFSKNPKRSEGSKEDSSDIDGDE